MFRPESSSLCLSETETTELARVLATGEYFSTDNVGEYLAAVDKQEGGWIVCCSRLLFENILSGKMS